MPPVVFSSDSVTGSAPDANRRGGVRVLKLLNNFWSLKGRERKPKRVEFPGNAQKDFVFIYSFVYL